MEHNRVACLALALTSFSNLIMIFSWINLDFIGTIFWAVGLVKFHFIILSACMTLLNGNNEILLLILLFILYFQRISYIHTYIHILQKFGVWAYSFQRRTLYFSVSKGSLKLAKFFALALLIRDWIAAKKWIYSRKCFYQWLSTSTLR